MRAYFDANELKEKGQTTIYLELDKKENPEQPKESNVACSRVYSDSSVKFGLSIIMRQLGEKQLCHLITDGPRMPRYLYMALQDVIKSKFFYRTNFIMYGAQPINEYTCNPLELKVLIEDTFKEVYVSEIIEKES